MTVTLESGVPFTADSVGREPRMRVIREAMEVVVRHLQKCEQKVFIVKTRESVESKCVPLLVPYRAD